MADFPVIWPRALGAAHVAVDRCAAFRQQFGTHLGAVVVLAIQQFLVAFQRVELQGRWGGQVPATLSALGRPAPLNTFNAS